MDGIHPEIKRLQLKYRLITQNRFLTPNLIHFGLPVF